MILIWLIAIPMIGGVLAWLTARKSETACRWISLLSMVVDLAVALFIWAGHFSHATIARADSWLINFDVPWIAHLGIHFHLAIVTRVPLPGEDSMANSFISRLDPLRPRPSPPPVV